MRTVDANPHSDGFVLTEWGEWTPDDVRPVLARALGAGAGHVTLLVELAQAESPDSPPHWSFAGVDEPFERGPQARRVRAVAHELKGRGVRVSLIPLLLWKGGRRQYLRPRAPEAWLERYGGLMEELAVFAAAIDACELVVGSELTCLFPHARAWRKIVARVRAHFRGHLTLCPTALDYATIRFWDVLDSVGVSAYFPLTPLRALREPRALALGWWTHRAHLEAVARLWHKPLTFVEVGYPATEVAAVRPWDYRFDERKLDLELQERCWRAFREVWAGARSLRSFRIWGLSSRSGPYDKTHNPLGKPAEATVASLFAERG
jgi:hypothetical protein